MIPCEGIYADIRKEPGDFLNEYSPGMKKIIEAYDKYKNQFSSDKAYEVSGK